ncbi:MAG: type IV secretion system protein, partial [Gammaproteobacteria bacterium]
ALLTCLTLSLSEVAQANWFQDIINVINKQGGITNNWLSTINSQEAALLESQRDVNRLMKQVNDHLTGHSGWGTYQFHDYQSYGEGARDWSSVLRMAENGQGSGALGQVMGGLSKQFPSNSQAFNKGVSDSTTQKYYAVKARTILASRAASQLDYDKIHDQIAYQQMLQQQIEKTHDLKAAIDLSNRIQVEGNLITLEILRQSALTNQQQAINEQASLNSSLDHAKFLTKK